MLEKEKRRLKIKARIRKKISGTPERPRLSVFRSNKQIYAQVIDDQCGKTLASASSLKIEEKLPKGNGGKSWRTYCQKCQGSRY